MAIEEKQLEATEKPESRIEDLLVQVIDMIKSGGSSTEGTQFEPPPQSRDEEILYATLQGQPYTNKPESRIEDLYIQLKEAIETSSGATLIEKSITANGTYSASDDDADGYSSVNVEVPNTYTAGDEGKVVNNGALVSQTSTTATTNGTINTTTNNEVVVNVPNTYTAGDEGKVVSGGALVSQTSTTCNTNGTINTTTNNEVVVNVPNTYTAGDEGKVVSGGALVAQTARPTEITDNGTYDTTMFNSVTVNASPNQLVIPCSLPTLRNSPKDAIAFITIDKINKKLNFILVAGETTPSRKLIITNNYGDTYEFVPQIILSDLITSISQYPDFYGYGWGTDTSGTVTTDVGNAPTYSQLSIDLVNNKIIYTPTTYMYNHVMLFYSYDYT